MKQIVTTPNYWKITIIAWNVDAEQDELTW